MPVGLTHLVVVMQINYYYYCCYYYSHYYYYNTNKIGPKIEPCGTPLKTSLSVSQTPYPQSQSTIFCFVPLSQFSIHLETSLISCADLNMSNTFTSRFLRTLAILQIQKLPNP